MNIYRYIRVSSAGQLDGDGPERQRDAISAFCNKFALVNAGEYVEAISGTKESMDRPVFTEMLMSIDRLNALNNPALRVDAIVVERLDRLAREMMVSEMLLRACRDRGIKLFATDQGQIVDMADTSEDPTRTLMRQILAAIAQWEKSVLVMKMNAAKSRIKAEKGRCGGAMPFGHLPGEKDILDIIQIRSVHGDSYATIAATLNHFGYKTRQQKSWTKDRVQFIRRGRPSRPLLKVKPSQINEVTPFTLQPIKE